jgi:DNA polymerase I
MLQYVPPVTFVDTPEKMMRVVKHVRDTKCAALDTETSGLDRARDVVKIWSLCPSNDTRYCITKEMLDIYDEELATDPNISWYFTNQTFDMCMLDNSMHEVPVGPCYDTLAMDWLNNENKRHGLKETAWEYLGYRMPSFKDTFPSRKRGESISDRIERGLIEEPEKTYDYASSDAWATFRVFEYLKKSLSEQQSSKGMNYWDYFKRVEMPFTRVLFNLINRGIMVDKGYLDDLRPLVSERIDKLQWKINKLAGKQVNPNSPKQLIDLLFGTLKHKPITYTPGGESGNRQPSTDESVLKILADSGCKMSALLLEHRGLKKFLSTYVDGMAKWIDSHLRIHPTLTQFVTVTGRLSSVDPNLQNLPRPEGDDFLIRDAFIPKPGYVFAVFDYEQLEMRIMAHFSGDKNMQKVIKDGKDIHTGTASLMFGHDYDAIKAAIKRKKKAAQDSNIKLTELERDMCFSRLASKEIGFALNYGEGARALAAKLRVSVERAKELIELYFKPYPSVQEHIEWTHKQARTGIIETLLGRPRRFPELLHLGDYGYYELTKAERIVVSRADRQATNSEIQGSAADVARMAMLRCENDLDLKDLGVEMLLQIHDELIFEVPEENIKEAIPLIKEDMEHPLNFELDVPLQVDIGTGQSWYAAKA